MPMANDDSNSNNKNSLVIKPTELKRKMNKGYDIFILDVRGRQEYDMWTISNDNYPDSLVIPIDALASLESLKQIPKNKEVITFCAHGQRSFMAARNLASLGYNVRTVEGGMAGLSRSYDVAEVNLDSNITLKIWQEAYQRGARAMLLHPQKIRKQQLLMQHAILKLLSTLCFKKMNLQLAEYLILICMQITFQAQSKLLENMDQR